MSASAAGHDGLHPHHHADDAPTETAKGKVFDDLNGNGLQDANEQGVAGVRISNGKEIVQTDSDGKYKIPVSNDSIIFIIKPRGFSLPLNAQNLPQFYYIHKPAGSPKSRFPGVAPTGPLPESIDFALLRSSEPEKFKAILFGDPQPRNIEEVEYIEHDVIEQIVASQAHDASFGVTLGDIVFDDLAMMEPLSNAIALIGIPWYNVIGNHDLNLDAASDQLSDETFERHYGPSYYSFDHGPAHFLVLDDVSFIANEDGGNGKYVGGLGARQLEFIRRDLDLIPETQLVVLLMHIPLTDVGDRGELYRLIEKRPATVSVSAHTHYMEHRYIDSSDGWQGPEPHHHIVNVTVCGSWWSGQKDERGIPHATMSDGGPNGYSVMSFDGFRYSLDFYAANRPANKQMQIYAPERTTAGKTIDLSVNVFAASELDTVEARIGDAWVPLNQKTSFDPSFVDVKLRESKIEPKEFRELTRPHATPHFFTGKVSANVAKGSHLIRVRWTDASGKQRESQRMIRVE